MGDLQFSGLSTGIDTTSIVQGLLEAEKSRMRTYEMNLAGHEQKRTTISEMQTKLNSFKSAVNALSDSSQLRSFKASSSDADALDVSASSNAYEGSHTVQIKQLATADRLIHDGYKYETSYVGEGDLLLSYNGQQMSVTTTDETTLEDLAELINNDQNNPGITASILRYDDGSGNEYHLVLSGKDSGSDYQIIIDDGIAEVQTSDEILETDSETAGIKTQIQDMDDFSGSITDGDFTNVTQVSITGTDNAGAAITQVDMEVTQYSTIEDLVGEIESAFGDNVKVIFEDGQFEVIDQTTGVSSMTLNLEFVAGAESANLTFSQTTAGAANASSIAALDATTFVETQDAQDSLFRVDGYPVVADEDNPDQWISRSSNTIDDVIAGTTLTLQGVTGNDTDGYDTIDVNLSRDTEKLTEKVNKMIEAYNEVVVFLDEQTTYNEETGTSGLLSREYALTSVESLFRNSLLLNATGFTDGDSFLNPKDIGLELDAEGMLSLDQNTFDEAIVDDYLGVLALIGAEKSGSTSDTDAAYIKFYDSSNDTTAGTFNVRVLADGSAWIKLEDEDWDDAREATIDGNTIYGNNDWDFDTHAPMNPEYNLQLTIDTDEIGRQMDVTVDIKQGFAGDLYDTVADFTKTDGRLDISLDTIESQIDATNRRISEEESRLERYEERLKARYARLEAQLSKIQQQFAGIAAL
ncbi:MAG: flagellar filament capping protein FliD [Planctomycetota bacterium]|jgi:flagellar hook-associated protein 2